MLPKHVEVAIYNDEVVDATLSNSLATEIATCPTFGITHGMMGKRNSLANRSLALDAGSACHRYYAAMKLFELRKEYPEHMRYHVIKLFGEPVLHDMLRALSNDPNDIIAFSLPALYSSNFCDDPKDRRRTMSNLEDACIAFTHSYDVGSYRPYISDSADPTKLIGVEMKFDTLVTIEQFVASGLTVAGQPIYFDNNKQFDDLCVAGMVKLPAGEQVNVGQISFSQRVPDCAGVYKIRWRGKVDALLVSRKTGNLIICEHKTASRIDDSWETSFVLGHQQTGYSVALVPYINHFIEQIIVYGMAIPRPKTGTATREVHTKRYADEHVTHWANWLLWAVQTYQRYKDAPEHAPRFTHACNRYFYRCAMLEYCALATDEDRRQMLSEMETVDPFAYHDE